jgi:hypothetical protein
MEKPAPFTKTVKGAAPQLLAAGQYARRYVPEGRRAIAACDIRLTF